MSMKTFLAAPLRVEPMRKVSPPPSIDHFRPNTLVTTEAKKEDTSAARYSDDVKRVSNWLSNLQYWFVLLFAFSLLSTSGKNFRRNESIDVTPPTSKNQIPQSDPNKKKKKTNPPRKNSIDNKITQIEGFTSPEMPISYPKMRPPVAATMQVNRTKSVRFPGYSFPPPPETTAPPAIVTYDRPPPTNLIPKDPETERSQIMR